MTGGMPGKELFMTQIERIEHYEQILERAEGVLRQLEEAQRAYDELREELDELERYYTSPAWRADYEADEAGSLPADLKRGVLSQDGVYSLLEQLRELKENENNRK